MLVYRYAYNIPGSKKYYEQPKLIVKNIDGKQFYWNFAKNTWVRLTKRCPYLG